MKIYISPVSLSWVYLYFTMDFYSAGLTKNVFSILSYWLFWSSSSHLVNLLFLPWLKEVFSSVWLCMLLFWLLAGFFGCSFWMKLYIDSIVVFFPKILWTQVAACWSNEWYIKEMDFWFCVSYLHAWRRTIIL